MDEFTIRLCIGFTAYVIGMIVGYIARKYDGDVEA